MKKLNKINDTWKNLKGLLRDDEEGKFLLKTFQLTCFSNFQHNYQIFGHKALYHFIRNQSNIINIENSHVNVIFMFI